MNETKPRRFNLKYNYKCRTIACDYHHDTCYMCHLRHPRTRMILLDIDDYPQRCCSNCVNGMCQKCTIEDCKWCVFEIKCDKSFHKCDKCGKSYCSMHLLVTIPNEMINEEDGEDIKSYCHTCVK